MAIAAILFAIVLHPTNLRIRSISADPVSWRIVGEAVSVYLGGLGMITGLYLGLVLLKTGIHIEGRDELGTLGADVGE